MNIAKIDKLMAALEELKRHKDYKKISIQLNAEEFEILIGQIHDYTIKLAKDNEAELAKDELWDSHAKHTDTIINFQNCLKIQKRIFEIAA